MDNAQKEVYDQILEGNNEKIADNNGKKEDSYIKNNISHEEEEKKEMEVPSLAGKTALTIKELSNIDQKIIEDDTNTLLDSLKIEDTLLPSTSTTSSTTTTNPTNVSEDPAAKSVGTSSLNGNKENNPAINKKREKRAKDRKEKKDKKNKKSDNDLHCIYCNVTFTNKNEFQLHCKGDKHQQVIMSDEGKTWRFRQPPRRVGSEVYKLCLPFLQEGCCLLGNQCTDAHSENELSEWKEHFEFRQNKAQKASKLYKSFNDTLLERLTSNVNVENVLKTKVDDVICQCDNATNVTVSDKTSTHCWIFTLETKGSQMLQNVSLLNETNGQQFALAFIKQSSEIGIKTFYQDQDQQEWSHPESLQKSSSEMVYKVKVSFQADIFGTFRQSVVFSFGQEPYLRQDVSVDVKPLADDEDSQLQELQNNIIQQAERWDKTNCAIKDFDPPLQVPSVEDQLLYQTYPAPQPSKFKPSKSVIEPHLTKNNYRSRMHELLYIEEMAQFEQVSQFNVRTNLLLVSKYLLMTTSTHASTAKYARPGELFGKLTLKGSLCEDTPAGRLILTNCATLLLMDGSKIKKNKDRVAYVTGIEDSGKATLYLRLSSSVVQDFVLKEEEEFSVEVQFQLNRLPICEMHLAVDNLPDLNLVYPEMQDPVQIPWTPSKQWSEELSSKLNPKQREAILAITSSLTVPLPPILIIGPYGTGKTFTMAQAIKILLKQEGSRILVCTHSNSAADLYIRDYLDPYITENPNLNLLRVYYKNRWVQTVHASVQKYCLFDDRKCFRSPTLEDVDKCNIVVATLSTSRYLSTIGLPVGHFTHILLDEAAQAMECEAIMPLALAQPNKTRVVLAGDHMQLSPEVFSTFAQDSRFNKSLLERLYDHYPPNFRCKILLCENYRSHEAIINYTSELFYEQKLLASGNQSKHEKWYPLTVFTARGEDVQDSNSTSFYNNAEVYEVVERVAELQKDWPIEWGQRDENSIGIVTPYYDQVQRIRSELRKRRLYGVSVERVLNVQGKQFRAIFLSTVRTRKTCITSQEDTDMDFGFLSNAKLLNTAITRAQSLVAVVGDPVALCSVGKCRKLWERFVDTCRKYKSLFGLTWAALRVMLDNCELKKPYILNPLAKEFVPRAKRYQETFLHQMFTALQAEAYKTSAYSLMSPQMMTAWGPPPMIHRPPFMGFFPPPALPHMAAHGLAPWSYMDSAMTFPPGVPIPPPPSQHMSVPPPSQQVARSFAMLRNERLLEASRFSTSTPMMSNRPQSPVRQQLMSRMATAPQQMAVPMHPPMINKMNRRQQPPLANTKYFANKYFPGPLIPPQQQQQQQPTTLQASINNGSQQSLSGHTPLMSLPPPHLPMSLPQHPADKSFTFLKDGVHFPPVPSTPPPRSIMQTNHFPKLMEQTVPDRNCRRNQPVRPEVTPQHENRALMDSALDVLPQDIELTQFLSSPQMQMAWFNHLTVSKGRDEAVLFKELVVSMQQNPELLADIRRQLATRKDQAVQLQKLHALKEGGTIPGLMAQDLEASWLRETNNSSKVHQQPPSVLMPSATSADAFFTLANAHARQQQKFQHNEPPSALRHDPILNEVLRSDDTSSPDSGCWGSVGSMLGQNQIPQGQQGHHEAMTQSGHNVPLYKRRAVAAAAAAASTGQNEDNNRMFQFPTSTFPNNVPILNTSVDLAVPTSPIIGLAVRSSTMPSSYSPFAAGEGPHPSPYNRTYANVLRQKQQKDTSDPLFKIRQLGTRGSRELEDEEYSQTNANSFQPFSPFDGRW